MGRGVRDWLTSGAISLITPPTLVWVSGASSVTVPPPPPFRYSTSGAISLIGPGLFASVSGASSVTVPPPPPFRYSTSGAISLIGPGLFASVSGATSVIVPGPSLRSFSVCLAFFSPGVTPDFDGGVFPFLSSGSFICSLHSSKIVGSTRPTRGLNKIAVLRLENAARSQFGYRYFEDCHADRLRRTLHWAIRFRAQ